MKHLVRYLEEVRGAEDVRESNRAAFNLEGMINEARRFGKQRHAQGMGPSESYLFQ